MCVVQESHKEKIGTVEFVKYGEGNQVELPEIEIIREENFIGIAYYRYTDAF